MRVVTNPAGVDTTAIVQGMLLQNNALWIADLFQISTPLYQRGVSYNPANNFFVTPFDGQLRYDDPAVPGTPRVFLPSAVKRGQIITAVGLEAQTMKLSWAPRRDLTYNLVTPVSSGIKTLYQHAADGAFDNGCIRMWKVFMPTPGDCVTLGACPYFMGRISEVDIEDDWLTLEAKHYTDILDQEIPRYLVGPANRVQQLGIYGGNGAGFNNTTGEQLSTSFDGTNFTIQPGTTVKQLNVLGPSGHLYPPGFFESMYVFLGSGYPTIASTVTFSDNDGHVNRCILARPLDGVVATGTGIVFYQALPADQQSSGLSGVAQMPGFPFVPRPEDQI